MSPYSGRDCVTPVIIHGVISPEREAVVLQAWKEATVVLLLFFFTLFTGPRKSLRLKLSDTGVYEPQIRARLGTTAHFE